MLVAAPSLESIQAWSTSQSGKAKNPAGGKAMASDPVPVHDMEGKAPACPAPDPAPHGPRRFTVPPGAVDTHAHVIGLPPHHPFVETRSYTPPEATPQAYLRMLDATGMTFGVLVQVSVHGTDNRLMLETLRTNPQRLKGIGVVPLGLPDASYARLSGTLFACVSLGVDPSLALVVEGVPGRPAFHAVASRRPVVCRCFGWVGEGSN
jgi:hypothetical protein